MTPTPKANREPIVEDTSEKQEIRENFATLFLHGLERMAEVQKKTIDLAVQQNVEMIDVFKKAVEKVPGFSRLPMLDVMTNAYARYADTQKCTIDLVVEQSQVWTDAFKSRAAVAGQSTESVTSLAKQTMERSAAVQKKALENTAAHAKAAVDVARQEFGFTGTQADTLAESFHRGVNTIVEAQKELIDLVTH